MQTDTVTAYTVSPTGAAKLLQVKTGTDSDSSLGARADDDDREGGSSCDLSLEPNERAGDPRGRRIGES